MALTGHMLIAAGVLVAAYVVIFTERMHRTSAALLGAVIMVAVGTPWASTPKRKRSPRWTATPCCCCSA
jgi:Na+/H+ antiporter NhaD/arsenite permease-like protein